MKLAALLLTLSACSQNTEPGITPDSLQVWLNQRNDSIVVLDRVVGEWEDRFLRCLSGTVNRADSAKARGLP